MLEDSGIEFIEKFDHTRKDFSKVRGMLHQRLIFWQASSVSVAGNDVVVVLQGIEGVANVLQQFLVPATLVFSLNLERLSVACTIRSKRVML